MSKHPVNDYRLAAELVSKGSIKGAAESLKLSEKTITRRIQTESFKQIYDQAQTELLQQVIMITAARITTAIDVITEIMMNNKTNPSVRLQSCQTLLATANRYADRWYQQQEKKMRENQPLWSTKALLERNRHV